mmetsp:Transcript_51396/g.102096  ORF Transcript_51396/g.102096 Transcript_51396/m.102096 type:complete len:569 (-) Transcript_51396:288-1994(-)
MVDAVSTTADTLLEVGRSREDSCLSELCRDTNAGTIVHDASGLSDFSPEASSLVDSMAPSPVAQAQIAVINTQQTTFGGGGSQEKASEAQMTFSSEENPEFRSTSTDACSTSSTMGQSDMMQRWHERRAARKTRRKSSKERLSYGSLAQAAFCSSKKKTDVDALANETGVRLCQQQLGAGSFSRVCKGTWTKPDNSIVSVAVKVIRQRWTNPELSCNVSPGTLPECVEREARVTYLDHENLLKVHMTQITKLPYFFVMDLCAGGNLHDLLYTQRLEPCDGEPVPRLPQLGIFSWRQRTKVALDIANGMEYLHRHDFMHRDLKSHNVLLAEPILSHADEPLAKVCDFGLAKKFNEEVSTTSVGSWHYMAPEVFEAEESGVYQHNHCGKADVYSYAMILYELLTECMPFDNINGILLGPIVLGGRRPEVKLIPFDAPDVLQKLLVSCWVGDSAERPAFGQISKDLTASFKMMAKASSEEPATPQTGSALGEQEAEPPPGDTNHVIAQVRQLAATPECSCAVSPDRVLGEQEAEQKAEPSPSDTNHITAQALGEQEAEPLLGETIHVMAQS